MSHARQVVESYRVKGPFGEFASVTIALSVLCTTMNEK